MVKRTLINSRTLRLVCILICGLPAAPLAAAEATPPTLRRSADWIILSGIADTGHREGPVPWTHAIRGSLITSVSIHPDYLLLENTGPGPNDYHPKTAEELQAMPAEISITTSELGRDGRFKTYDIRGLTFAAAPAFMDRILAAAGTPRPRAVRRAVPPPPADKPAPGEPDRQPGRPAR